MMKAWAAALLMLVGSTIAFLQYGIPWFVYGALYYSILAIPILLFDGLRLAPATPKPLRGTGGMRTEKPI